jgi:D-arginine dehydrogenase
VRTSGGENGAVQRVDVIVIGGGMAGVSLAYEIAARRRVALLEMEPALAYHTTGRSAAMFLESYGGTVVRALTTASRAFLEARQVLRPLPLLSVARPGRGAAVEELFGAVRALVPDVQLLDGEQAVRAQPLLRPGAVERAMLEPGATEIDVAALHQFYLTGFRERGGQVVTRARVDAAEHRNGAWQVHAGGVEVHAPVVVNAAGAWADAVARVFGAWPVGVQPMRRTAFMVDAPAGAGAPMIADVDDTFYLKPDAGRLLCSPSEETPHEPADVRADELEIARAIDAINETTLVGVRHVRARWAGLRTFVADRTPVVGYDGEQPGFFWYAGQGGYGIQLAAALARTGAALLCDEAVPSDVADLGVSTAHLSPMRLDRGRQR